MRMWPKGVRPSSSAAFTSAPASTRTCTSFRSRPAASCSAVEPKSGSLWFTLTPMLIRKRTNSTSCGVAPSLGSTLSAFVSMVPS